MLDKEVKRTVGYASKLLNKKEAKQQPSLRERASIIFSLRHGKPYLIGKEFTFRTDHKPNLAIARGKTQVYDSLMDKIMSYLPFKLEYLSGKNMFAEELCRPLGYSSAIEPTAKSISELLEIEHDEAGHMSTKYMLQNLETMFSWPNMHADADHYVCSCKTCLEVNVGRPHNQEALQNLTPPALQLGYHIHVDLVDMPRASSWYVAICTLVDSATGFTILRPVLYKTSVFLRLFDQTWKHFFQNLKGKRNDPIF